MDFSLEAYLDRLGINAPAATEEGLARLQEAQLRSITFENLDPLAGLVPSLRPEDLMDKLVARQRGGYCFELNGLFSFALAALGFTATPILARVRRTAEEGGIRSHLAFVVTIGEREWLADVGFGGPGARFPLLIEVDRPETQDLGTYRLVEDVPNGETVLQRDGGDGWVSLYGFDRVPVRAIDIEAANFLCACWDQAPFSTNLMLNRVTARGRISAFNTAVTEIRDGATSKRTLENADALRCLLRDDFGLTIDEDMVAAAATKLKLADDASAARSVA